MTKRLSFFALKSDLFLILNLFEEKESVLYTLSDSMEKPEPQSWSHANDIEDLGIADGEQTLSCRSFLITAAETPVIPRRIEQFDGKIRFDIDQMDNQDSIVFTPAGEWKREMIIAGLFATSSSSSGSQALMKHIGSLLKKHFVKVNAYWVGPEALLRLRNGGRLTMAEQSPPIYDLREASQG